jgi:hypothetical protein
MTKSFILKDGLDFDLDAASSPINSPLLPSAAE